MVQWTGGITTLDSLALWGSTRVAVAAGWTQRGQFVEVVPYERVVYTWGWEGAGVPIPACATRIASSIPEGNGTLLLYPVTWACQPNSARSMAAAGTTSYRVSLLLSRVATQAPTPGKTPVLERTVRIEALPQTIFGCLTQADLAVGWMGVTATLGPRRGGTYYVNITRRNAVQGECI